MILNINISRNCNVIASEFLFKIPSIRINKVNRIIGTIGIWGEIIVLFCKRVLLEEDGSGRVVEPCAEVQKGLMGGIYLCQ